MLLISSGDDRTGAVSSFPATASRDLSALLNRLIARLGGPVSSRNLTTAGTAPFPRIYIAARTGTGHLVYAVQCARSCAGPRTPGAFSVRV